jgi:hypothetical protein
MEITRNELLNDIINSQIDNNQEEVKQNIQRYLETYGDLRILEVNLLKDDLIEELRNKKTHVKILTTPINILIDGLIKGDLMPTITPTKSFQGFQNLMGDGMGGKNKYRSMRKSKRKSKCKSKRKSKRKL